MNVLLIISDDLAATLGSYDHPLAKTPHLDAFTEARRGEKAEYWGRSIRTPRWRYTEWNGGRNGVELYDHENDPGEFANLALDPEHASIIASLKPLLEDKTIPPPKP